MLRATYILVCAIVFSAGTIRLHEEVYNSLFKNETRYNKHVLPQPVSDITVGFAIRKLMDLHEKTQLFECVGVFELRWVDERLSWQHPESVTQLVLPTTDIWLPDIYAVNTVSDGYEFTIKNQGFVELSRQGEILFNPTGQLSLFCQLDMSMFPFDDQICTVAVTSWVYSTDNIRLIPGANTVQIGARNDPQWDFVANVVSCLCATWNGKNYSKVSFEYHIRRKPMYYIMTIILPALWLSVLSLVNFALPAHHDQRIALLIAVILAFTVFQIQLGSVVPRTSTDLPFLNHYMTAQMGFVAIGVFFDALVQRVLDADAHTAAVRHGKLYGVIELLAMKIQPASPNSRRDLKNGNNGPREEEMADSIVSRNRSTRLMAEYLSRAFFWIYAGEILFSSVVYFSVMLFNGGLLSPVGRGCGFTCEITKPYTEVY